MLKRWTALLLAVMLVLLTACGAQKEYKLSAVFAAAEEDRPQWLADPDNAALWEQLGLSGGLLLLRQDLLKLDLYGTIRGAVSTFDTFNHIPDLDKAIANAGFFMEKGGVLLFDMNTPYKHQNVLGENVFTFEEEDASCVWRNHYSAADRRVEISVDIDYRETGEHFHEQFYEYTYDLDTIRTALEKHGFALESVCDGESFGPLTDESERYFFCAVKQYTQLEDK